MTVILEIGNSLYLCPDAVTAAKVADLLGNMEPLVERWVETAPTEHVLIRKREPYSHRVRLECAANRRLFADEAACLEWERERAAAPAGKDGAQ